MASIVAASRPHSTARWPCRAISAASAVPQEPAPRMATEGVRLEAGVCMPRMGSGVAGGFRVGKAVLRLLLLLLSALAQAFRVQRVEVDRLQQERREAAARSEEHTSELQSRENLVCRLLLEKK